VNPSGRPTIVANALEIAVEAARHDALPHDSLPD
jgi:hypothetical protein